MDAVSAKKLLDMHIENAARMLNEGFGVNHAESIFFDIIRLLRQESELKPYFLEKVARTFSSPDVGRPHSGIVPRELIELVAHELRWAELRELARLRITNLFGGNTTLAIGDIANSINDAYSDNWQDREFYEHYKAKNQCP